jgi:hypothetical protein
MWRPRITTMHLGGIPMARLNSVSKARTRRSAVACFSTLGAVAITLGCALVLVLGWVWASGAVGR